MLMFSIEMAIQVCLICKFSSCLYVMTRQINVTTRGDPDNEFTFLCDTEMINKKICVKDED